MKIIPSVILLTICFTATTQLAYSKYAPAFKVAMKNVKKEESGLLISRPEASSEALYRGIVLENMSSLEDYALWLKTNFTYKKDKPGFDIWAKPQETLTRGGGDCEDLLER
jgi:hypothetical protein